MSSVVGPVTLRYPGKYVGLARAFYQAAAAAVPSVTVVDVEMDPDGGADLLVQLDAPAPSDADQAAFDAFVAAYADPPCFLTRLGATENLPLSSAPTNATTTAFLQAFAVQALALPPDAPPEASAATQHLTTVVRCTTDNLPYFATWDAAADPITATVCVADWQTDAVLASATVDLSDVIAQRWVPLAQAPDQPAAAAALSNMQAFGPCVCKTLTLEGVAPTQAAIWHLRGFVSNSNAHVSVNGLQRTTYAVEYPAPRQ